MQNRPRFDARNKQPGRAARHPIPAPDFRVGKSRSRAGRLSLKKRSRAVSTATASSFIGVGCACSATTISYSSYRQVWSCALARRKELLQIHSIAD
jgi:hypothetical protein